MRAVRLILAACALAAAPAGLSIDDFHLPPKSVFSTAMPRYPTGWFYLAASLTADHQAGVKRVTGELRQALRVGRGDRVAGGGPESGARPRGEGAADRVEAVRNV